MRILGINGIRSDGQNNTDRLLRELEKMGYETVDVSYPRVNVFTARSRKRQLKNAQLIREVYQPGDAVIAHSYGCLLTLRAMEIGCEFSQVFYFGAAMNDDFSFPFNGMVKLWNYHNPNDMALTLGRLLAWHDFGAMGQTGYRGPLDQRIRNIPMRHRSPGRFSMNHSHYFLNPFLGVITKKIDAELQGARHA